MAWKVLVDDHAVSAIVAEVVLIGIAVIVAVVLMAAYAGEPHSAPASAVGLTSESSPDAQTRAFAIASAIPRLEWAGLEVALGGEPLAYDGALSSDATWCVVVEGASCADSLAGARLSAGNQLRVRDAAISGETLTLRQVETNALLYRATLR